MTTTEITAAARLIRPILASQLSLCRAVYPPAHDDAGITTTVEHALKAFDKMVAALSATSPQPATEQDKQTEVQL